MSTKVTASLLLVALVLAACGRPPGEVEDGSAAALAAAGETSPSTPTTLFDAAALGGPRAGDFGDLTEVCGPGNGSGATDVGVTDERIRVGTIADPGAEIAPGVNQELFDAAEAFVAWCNEAGGILGRQLEVDLLDAALVDYLPRVLEACEQDLALVGGGGVFDDTGTAQRVACGLPDFNAITASPLAADADLLVEAIPNPSGSFDPTTYSLVERDLSGPPRVGVLWFNAPQGQANADKALAAIDQLGWDVVYTSPYNLMGEVSWGPFVQSMRDAGVNLLLFFAEPAGVVALQQAMAEQGWYPEVTFLDPSHYNGRYLATGADNARNTLIWLRVHPFEEADENPATRRYLDVLAEEVPGAEPSFLGVQAFSAWLLFAQSAKACGSELTRECLWDEAQQVREWTGGGLHVPTDPTSKEPSSCAVLLRVTPDGYVRHTPDEGFAC